jgi:hypothetical protein
VLMAAAVARSQFRKRAHTNRAYKKKERDDPKSSRSN